MDPKKIKDLIRRYPRLSFLDSPQFRALPKEKQDYVYGLIEDAQFWIDQDKNPESDNRFLFLGSVLGLMRAEADADSKGLAGKEREKYLAPQKALQSRYNPYSGNVTAETTRDPKKTK
ncbi:MAG: hypothetical protein A3I75_00805 [Deltaproteobacteria bacterium RIFCSPLOWO2_02_FULL_50_16]|nr:MAG: hypothetical protein A2053_04595 [Deltaproteobacteria bacterium GWA2_50_8]OGQ30511.1 MAG: hypothetical protein A3B79_02525 [Deltaproteobacteria bacterium RIFCSPHIGHO2_02_FULL_50_15]OGQ56367.1 MAG: hypothetical protein A3I75_00805 [Deltaproteobacteria bacterium RIFCSPLOWO2_02_FULL_50_16]OGQ67770.1 MAG: hypothetical protein A3F89_02050 [Deltaproteobacteria bacterium RIFCSPLOWO2_12_FULL_50_11]